MVLLVSAPREAEVVDGADGREHASATKLLRLEAVVFFSIVSTAESLQVRVNVFVVTLLTILV